MDDLGGLGYGPYYGMTTNERLYHAQLEEAWEQAVAARDREEMFSILERIDLTRTLAEKLFAIALGLNDVTA
jgi:hypothetical protein